MKLIRIVVGGCGHMGGSHARAYHELEGFEIVGLVARGASKKKLNRHLGADYALFDAYEEALAQTSPDAVCIATYPDTHKDYAIKAFEAGAHVFIEKPLAEDVAGAREVVDAAVKHNKKLVVGYILRYHPSW